VQRVFREVEIISRFKSHLNLSLLGAIHPKSKTAAYNQKYQL